MNKKFFTFLLGLAAVFVLLLGCEKEENFTGVVQRKAWVCHRWRGSRFGGVAALYDLADRSVVGQQDICSGRSKKIGYVQEDVKRVAGDAVAGDGFEL